MTPTNKQAIHLYNIGDDVYVAVEVDGEWIPVIHQCAPGYRGSVAFSCIAEPNATPMAGPKAP